MDWATAIVTPIMAGLGAATGGFLTTRTARSGQLWEVVRECSERTVSDHERTSELAFNQLSGLIHDAALNKAQRSFARQAVRAYVSAARRVP